MENSEKIKNLIYRKFGQGGMTKFAIKYDLNYQELSNVLNGRCRNKNVLEAIKKEFKIIFKGANK
jgi:hypothetical protein